MQKLKSLRFLAVEKATFIYILITTIVVLVNHSKSFDVVDLLGDRVAIFATLIALAFLNQWKELRIFTFARYAFIGGLLSFWYPETYDINRVFLNHDNLIAGWEQVVFNCQPSVLFEQKMPQNWFSEFVNMGYFSYYPIILGSTIYFYFFDNKRYDKFFFVVMCSFYIYYIIYILFPTAGPQYYFYAIHIDQLNDAVFPAIGHYFNFHNSLYESSTHSGIFHEMVEHTQQLGERPTAAFPSSHVGISTLILYFLYKSAKYKVVLAILPLYIALMLATVYIQAHYVVDVIVGFFSAFFYYFILEKIYYWLIGFSEFPKYQNSFLR